MLYIIHDVGTMFAESDVMFYVICCIYRVLKDVCFV